MKTIKLENCDECPYNDYQRCLKTNKHIDDPRKSYHGFPEHCPLGD
jgi:hypothetical protein